MRLIMTQLYLKTNSNVTLMTLKFDQQFEIFMDIKQPLHACKLSLVNCLNDSTKYLQLVRQGIQTKKTYHM